MESPSKGPVAVAIIPFAFALILKNLPFWFWGLENPTPGYPTPGNALMTSAVTAKTTRSLRNNFSDDMSERPSFSNSLNSLPRARSTRCETADSANC